jgi:hypothetical protein
MPKGNQAAATAPVQHQKSSNSGQKEMISLLKKIESHMASLVYYQQDSRGFTAGVEKAIAQPFVNERKDNALESMIKEEIKKALGE